VRTSTSFRPGAGIAGPVSADATGDRTPLDLICFSHLRWDFVYQRPQHLLSRAALDRRVFFWEEPLFVDGLIEPSLSTREEAGVCVVVPRMPKGRPAADVDAQLERMLRDFLAKRNLDRCIAWYYTPMALGFTRWLQPAVTVYDCMDELSAFRGAPLEMREREAELLGRAQVVLTGGRSLYESKRSAHPNVHCFPSSIDRQHFAAARAPLPEPEDQRAIPHPRAGFFGVLDERLDRELLAQVAALRPDLHFVMIGPVVKIAREDLPQAANLHYLGQKSYAELPAYIAHWDAAILPFAINESTAFISPTKTPEYLAAGRPVVSTPVRDVVRDYGEPGLVRIAGGADAFARALDAALRPPEADWRARVDACIAAQSWDATWAQMRGPIEQARPLRELPRSAEDPHPESRLSPEPPRASRTERESNTGSDQSQEQLTCTII
jgi:glycosyltransferase involved in cell wall biosynthesis